MNRGMYLVVQIFLAHEEVKRTEPGIRFLHSPLQVRINITGDYS